MVRANTNKSIKFHAGYLCHRETVHQLRFQLNFKYSLQILLVFLGHLTINSEMTPTKTCQCVVLSPQCSWRKIGGEEHVILKYGTDLWTTKSYFGLHIHAQSSACQQLSRFSLIGASSQTINTTGQHRGDVPEVPALLVMIHLRCDSPHRAHGLFSRPAPWPAPERHALWRVTQMLRGGSEQRLWLMAAPFLPRT